MRLPASSPPLASLIDLDSLLPRSGTRFIEVKNDLDGPLADFGKAFACLIIPAIRTLASRAHLTALRYNDRYLRSPLTIRLMADALAALRDELAVSELTLPVTIVTNPQKPNERQPYLFSHDWEWADDRDAVLSHLLTAREFDADVSFSGATHGRQIDLRFDDGKTIRVVLDQGFGPWRCPPFAKFNFGEDATTQASKINKANVLVAAQGPTYIVVTGT